MVSPAPPPQTGAAPLTTAVPHYSGASRVKTVPPASGHHNVGEAFMLALPNNVVRGGQARINHH